MYAKLINGSLKRAPKKVTHKGKIIVNPPEDVLLELGYYPVIYTDMPEAPEGQHAESSWVQGNSEIVQAWNFADNPPAPEVDEPTEGERIEALEAAVFELAEVIANG